MQSINVVEESDAPISSIWALLTDVSTWSSWGPWKVSEVEREGSPAPAGIGAIRRLHIGRRVLREETIVFEPEREMAYRVLSGIPVRDYVGRVELAQVGARVTITWSSTFVGSAPGLGPLVRRGLAPKFSVIAKGLARAAEAR